MPFFARIHRAFHTLSLYAVWVGGAALLLCAIMVTIDVIARKVAGVTMSGSDEITGYVFAIATTWAYAYVLLNRSNVRIDAAYGFFPRPLRATLDILGLVLLLIYMGYLTLKAFDVFWTSWQQNSVAVTTLATPQWIPQGLWFLGLLFFCATLIFVLVYSVTALVRRDFDTVQSVAGALSAQEEIAKETQGMGSATPGAAAAKER